VKRQPTFVYLELYEEKEAPDTTMGPRIQSQNLREERE
jgi:hypothetical protein